MNNQKKYQTKQKNIIKDLLALDDRKYYTAEQILKTLENNKTPVSKATLYRTLEQMIEADEIIKYNIDSSSTCYQYIKCGDLKKCHIHFKCKLCGIILHLDNEKIIQLDEELEKKYRISIDLEKTVLHGICNMCKEGLNEIEEIS